MEGIASLIEVGFGAQLPQLTLSKEGFWFWHLLNCVFTWTFLLIWWAYPDLTSTKKRFAFTPAIHFFLNYCQPATSHFFNSEGMISSNKNHLKLTSLTPSVQVFSATSNLLLIKEGHLEILILFGPKAVRFKPIYNKFRTLIPEIWRSFETHFSPTHMHKKKNYINHGFCFSIKIWLCSL